MKNLSYTKYRQLASLVLSIDPSSPEEGFLKSVVPLLGDVWLEDYVQQVSQMDIVQTSDSGFSYLFDIENERLIAAWGISHGRHAGARDASRMRGHPNSAGPLYHRGHAIPHSLGGPTDINLVSQLGKVNVGPFRPLERKAVTTPGSLYFTYWIYAGARPTQGGAPGQTPTGVEQGLLVAGEPLSIHHHGN